MKDVLSYSSSLAFAQILGLFSGFLVARWLSPTDFGTWNAVSLALVYGAFSELGSTDVMGRELPFYRGQGRLGKEKEVADTTLCMTLAGAAVVILVLLGISCWSGFSRPMAVGLRGMAIVLALQQLLVYHQVVLRCYNEFGLLSKLQVMLSVVKAVLAILMVFWLAFVGRVIAAILAHLIVVVYLLLLGKVRLSVKFDVRVGRQLVKIGLPLIIPGIIGGLLGTIDRLIIVTYLGATQLGYFSIAILISSFVFLIPGATNQIVYPRLTHRFGASGRNILSLQDLVLTPTKVLAYLVPILTGLAYLTVPVAVKWILPKYMPGVVAAQIVAIGTFFLSIVGVMQNFLITIGALRQYILIGFVALLFNILLDFLFLKLKFGIEGVAIAGTLLTYFFYATAIIGFVLSHFMRQRREWVRFIVCCYSPFVYCLLLLAGLVRFVNFSGGQENMSALLTLLSQALLFVTGCAPLLYLAWKEIKIGNILGTPTKLVV